MKLENNSCQIELKNNIIYGLYKCKKLDLLAAQETLDLRLKVCDGVKYPTIFDCTLVKEFTKEARDFFASPRSFEGIKISAIIINSPMGEMLGNFYLKLKRPPVRAKLFTTVKDAENWIDKMKTEG